MKSERKPLAFSTTMRNPERIAGFLNCIVPFEKQILTNDVIYKVIENLIKNKLYKPTRLTKEEKSIYKNDDLSFSDKQVKNIIKNNPQRHGEKGFDYGWPSRFDTMYKLSMEFGFIKYSMNKPIIISETGHMLIDAYNFKPFDSTKISNVMLNSMVKYHTNNPFRRNLNENIPLILLLKILKKLKNDNEENGVGIHRQELPLLICWPNDDENALYDFIKEIRKRNKFTYSNEYIYDICIALLGADETKKKRFKMSQICDECVDEYIRKMRSTGIISLRGNGRFIDINNFESNKIDYVLSNYKDVKKFKNENDYYNYVSTIDINIIETINNIKSIDKDTIRNKKLREVAKNYSKDNIFNELRLVCRKLETKDLLFKYLNAPTRLEFLISVSLLQNYEYIDIKPNYSIDDEGLPTFNAGGDKSDIECYDEHCDSFFEVTLMCGRQEQVNNEIIPIRRHLLEHKKIRDLSFSVFVAPVIHTDTKESVSWYKYKDNIDILTYDIEEFIKNIKETSEPIELLEKFYGVQNLRSGE